MPARYLSRRSFHARYRFCPPPPAKQAPSKDRVKESSAGEAGKARRILTFALLALPLVAVTWLAR